MNERIDIPVFWWILAAAAWCVDATTEGRWFITGCAYCASLPLANAILKWATESLWHAAKVFWAWAIRDE